MTQPFDSSERRKMCALLDELGPDAPTLCQGWTTADLAAHLVLREHFRRWPPEAIIKQKEQQSYPELVVRLRAGPPAIPWRIPGVRVLANGLEFLVHHEDVRRANGLGSRLGDGELDRVAWRMAGFLGRRLARKAPGTELVLACEDGSRRSFGEGPMASLRGGPVDLVLYLSGRRDAAVVTIDGDEQAQRALERAELSF